MTTYVLGAGGSLHAGFPLCSQLWPRMADWVRETESARVEHGEVIESIASRAGEVRDLEQVLTDLDQGGGAFTDIRANERRTLTGGFRRCVRGYLVDIHAKNPEAPLYDHLSNRVRPGDVFVTFNYDVALEGALIRAERFCVRDGYGFEQDWDEPNSPTMVLKPHGSINWNAAPFNRGSGKYTPGNEYGRQPYVDNVENLLPGYPKDILNKSFRPGAVTGSSVSLIPPSHVKKFCIRGWDGDEDNWVHFYETIWSQAEEALRTSERIVLIGYSMPDADTCANEVLLTPENQGAEVVLCCRDSNSNLEKRFRDRGFPRIRQAGRFEDYLDELESERDS